jgi:hypothetical protein
MRILAVTTGQLPDGPGSGAIGLDPKAIGTLGLQPIRHLFKLPRNRVVIVNS